MGNIILKLFFLGLSHREALHTETSTLPGLERGRETPMAEELAHMLRSRKGLNPSEQKCHKIKDDVI